MTDYRDLDEIKPEVKKIKVNGKVYEVTPPKVNASIKLLKLQKLIKSKTPEELADMGDEILETLRNVIPDAEEMDLSMHQLNALISFLLQPAEKIQPESAEKKTIESPTQSPSS